MSVRVLRLLALRDYDGVEVSSLLALSECDGVEVSSILNKKFFNCVHITYVDDKYGGMPITI